MDDEPATTVIADAESAHKIGHKTGRSSRVEVITGKERRRTWTLEQKREIVAESLGPELTPTEVARKYSISSGQLYTWRQQVLGGQMAVLSRLTPDFAQVEMTPAPQPQEIPDDRNATLELPRPTGLIEIVLPGSVILRVDAAVDAAALSRVLAALQQR